jgi:hypothetical protein
MAIVPWTFGPGELKNQSFTTYVHILLPRSIEKLPIYLYTSGIKVWWKSLHDKINLIAKRRYIENIQNMVDKNSINI